MTHVKITRQPREAKILDINNLYSPTHLAPVMGVSRDTIYRFIKDGRIPKKHIHDLNGTTMIYYVEKYY